MDYQLAQSYDDKKIGVIVINLIPLPGHSNMSLESSLKLLAPPEMENLVFWATPFLTVGKF